MLRRLQPTESDAEFLRQIILPPEYMDRLARIADRLEAIADCEHEHLSEDKSHCLGCGMKFIACRACSGAGGAGLPIYHGEPACSDED